MQYHKNTSYFIIPFSYPQNVKFADFNALIRADSDWEPVADEVKYMFKYVSDKLDSANPDACKCFHYELSAPALQKHGMGENALWHTVEEHTFCDEPTDIDFHILGVHLYCFNTRVCIMAVQLHFAFDDPLRIANAQYYLKKVSREALVTGGGQPITMLDFSKKLFERNPHADKLQFFFYVNPTTERANVLTHIEVQKQDDYNKELYYLRRCYSSGFLYTPDAESDKREIQKPSRDTVWGISSEAVVCLTCGEWGRKEFLQSTFYENFNSQYLFMCVLLLHQKYVLYHFLTRINTGLSNDTKTLEEYKNNLYRFETDFVFACITEVPQHQNIYAKMSEAFSLKEMYQDVYEPLISLPESKRTAFEGGTNRALIALSVLAVFSALIDSFDFASAIAKGNGITVLQTIFSVIIIGTFAYALVKLITAGKKK